MQIFLEVDGDPVCSGRRHNDTTSNTTMKKSIAQWIKDWNRDCVSIGLPPISRNEKLEMMRMRNLMIIADRNNWPSNLAMAIFPSNR